MSYDEDFKDAPLAYFISFRTFGTWLHGDRRGSVDRSTTSTAHHVWARSAPGKDMSAVS